MELRSRKISSIKSELDCPTYAISTPVKWILGKLSCIFLLSPYVIWWDEKCVVYFSKGCPLSEWHSRKNLRKGFQSFLWFKNSIAGGKIVILFYHFYTFSSIPFKNLCIRVKNRKNPGIEPNHKGKFDFVKTNEETLNVKSGQIGGECFCFPYLKY